MSLVANLEEGPDHRINVNFGGGRGHLFSCTCEHPEAGFLWQQEPGTPAGHSASNGSGGSRPAAGDSSKRVEKAGALGRRVKVVGMDPVFRPQSTIHLLWALCDEMVREAVEAAQCTNSCAEVVPGVEQKPITASADAEGAPRWWGAPRIFQAVVRG